MMMDHVRAALQLWQVCTGRQRPATLDDRATVALVRGALNEAAAEALLAFCGDARREAERCARLAERTWHGGPIARLIRERWQKIKWLTPVVAADDPVAVARQAAHDILTCLAEEPAGPSPPE